MPYCRQVPSPPPDFWRGPSLLRPSLFIGRVSPNAKHLCYNPPITLPQVTYDLTFDYDASRLR